MMGFGVSENESSQVAAMIMAGATLIAYIIGEGMVDASRTAGEGENSDA